MHEGVGRSDFGRGIGCGRMVSGCCEAWSVVVVSRDESRSFDE